MLRKKKLKTSDKLRNCWDKGINPTINRVGVETLIRVENTTLSTNCDFFKSI